VICQKKPEATYNVTFDNCLLVNKDNIDAQLQNCLVNTHPRFKDEKKMDYRPAETSPLIDNGKNVPGISNDLDDQPWVQPFDIGAYQYKP